MITSTHAKNLFDFKLKTAKGEELDLSSYKGKVVLISNIATQCGFTPQLKGLEELHDQYQNKGLVVLGIPSNDFGGQSPESDEKVAQFCEINYGVSFPLTQKYSVKGNQQIDLFKFIVKEKNGVSKVLWNFEKFLFDKNGQLIASYRSITKPNSKKLIKAIEEAL